MGISTIKNNKNLNKAISIDLKLLILLTPLVLYKNVGVFRANQEAWLKLFVLIGISLWILQYLTINGFIWKKCKIDLPIFLFILIMSGSLLISEYLLISVRDYIVFISYFILYFLIKDTVESKNEFNSFIRLFFITSLFVSIYTLLHYYGIISYLREFGPVISTLGQKNWTSNYLALIFPLMFLYLLLEKSKRKKIFYFISLSIIYATLVICQSRGIWISISLTIIFAIYIIFKFNLLKPFQENKRWLILLLVSFILITIIYSTDNPLNISTLTIPQRVVSTFDEQDPSVNTRILIWKNTLEMIKDNPLFGLGIGTFKMNYLDYQAKYLKNNHDYTRYWTNAKESHNEYLQMGAELGVIGVGIFFSILFIFYNLVLNYFKKETQNEKKIVIFGLVMGITCFLVHSLFTFPLHVPALGSAFFVIVGLTVVYINDFNLYGFNMVKNGKKNIKKRQCPSVIIFTIIILILLVTIFLIDSLVIRPYLAEVYAYKGKDNFELGNYNNALTNYEYAVKLDPYNGRILLNLGATYCNLNILNEAEKALIKSKKYISERNIHRNLGLCYLQSSDFEEAIEKFKKTIYLDPKYSEAYFYLGYLYFLQKDYSGAIEQWCKILEVDPDYSGKYIIFANLGIVYQKKEMPDKALKYFLEALQLAPEGSPIIEEIEEEIYNIYKSNLSN